jgi:hypothetical protein
MGDMFKQVDVVGVVVMRFEVEKDGLVVLEFLAMK